MKINNSKLTKLLELTRSSCKKCRAIWENCFKIWKIRLISELIELDMWGSCEVLVPNRQNRQTDIGDSKVTFATNKMFIILHRVTTL